MYVFLSANFYNAGSQIQIALEEIAECHKPRIQKVAGNAGAGKLSDFRHPALRSCVMGFIVHVM